MPVPWSLRGLRDGVVTTRWPKRADDYESDFRAVVEPVPHSTPAVSEVSDVVAQCPTRALSSWPGSISVDQGRCVACGRCVQAAPDLLRWRRGADTAQLTRARLVVPSLPENEESLAEVRERLAQRVRGLRRSVHIRHVDAGSDGADEWEVQALLNPLYDVHRLGIFFTASPRHADILLVTGISTPGMSAPLARTREAMPDPVVVIAAGTDAVSGGLFAHGYSSRGGIDSLLDVDVWVPGSPPSPFSLLHAILLALGRMPSAPSGER